MQKACQSEPMLAEVRHVLFEKDGGLVPQLKFSNEWKLKLRAISNVVSGNQKLFTQIAWSAVRFDESETLRLFCQMLLPVALLLAGQASDKRISPKLRGLAARTLESMNTDFVVSLGLFADLTHETQRLLRIFDSDWHDPAISRRCLANVRKRWGFREKGTGQDLVSWGCSIEGFWDDRLRFPAAGCTAFSWKGVSSKKGQVLRTRALAEWSKRRCNVGQFITWTKSTTCGLPGQGGTSTCAVYKVWGRWSRSYWKDWRQSSRRIHWRWPSAVSMFVQLMKHRRAHHGSCTKRR